MKIGELAQQSRCSTETIRYYEKIGLLHAPNRGLNNYRRYSAAHAERLRFIRNCRSLDMTHDEIRELLNYMDSPDENCAPINNLVKEHLNHVTTRITELQYLEQQLHELHQHCLHQGNVRHCGILETLNQSKLSPKGGNTHLG